MCGLEEEVNFSVTAEGRVRILLILLIEAANMARANGNKRLRFGTFEFDLAGQELFKRGVPVHLQDKPFQILALLLERPNEIVTREELQRRLWPNGTFVEFDEGLNTAVKKLRQALLDSADSPIFIETLPRRGY